MAKLYEPRDYAVEVEENNRYILITKDDCTIRLRKQTFNQIKEDF